MFSTIAPCRSTIRSLTTLKKPSLSISRLRANSPLAVKCDSVISNLDLKQTEFISVGQPQVHVMRGFSPFQPQPKVLETIRSKAEQFSVVSFPSTPTFMPLSSSGVEFSSAGFSSKVPTSFTNSRPIKIPSAQEAFFVLDLDHIRTKAALWNECFPTIKPHYAVKANPNPAIIRLMAEELKINFDCASLSEIESVLQEGVDPSRIIFANPCKSLAHISHARRTGVLRTTFDSEAELYKIKSVHPQAEVVLRIWVDDKDAQCQLSNKYGAHLEEAFRLLELVHHLDLDCIGVSFHVGSGASPLAFRDALRDARKVFDKGADLGMNMRLLDIGGGFPGTDQDDISLPQIAKLVNPIIKRNFDGIELIAEPGRFFCSESQTLATQIIGKRLRPGNGLSNRREYYINDGLYQSFNCILYDHSILLKESHHEGENSCSQQGAIVPKYPSLIFGQTCDGLDTISKDILLPDLRVGDWLVVPTMGAYTNGASSSFNGFPLNSAIVLDSKSQSEF